MEFDHGRLSDDRARPVRPAPCLGEAPDARQGPPGPPSGLVRLVHARSAVDPPDPQGNFFAEEIKDSEQECAVRTLSGFLPIIIPVEHGLGIVVSEFFVP